MLAGALLPCLLAGCGGAPAEAGDGGWDPAKAHALGLTQEQRLEDYDYFRETLQNSYLCMGVRDRENPDDPSADLFRDYREMIAESDSDEAFYSAVYSTLYRLGTYGHLWSIEPEGYREMLETCQSGVLGEDRAHWAELIEDPGTQAFYERLAAMLPEEPAGGGQMEGTDGETRENVHTLRMGDVGYVKVDGFPADYEAAYEKERQQIFSFYDTLEGCTDLIIDVTENGGGGERYWQDLLVAPFLDAPLSCTNYALLADSENNRPFIENVLSQEELYPIADLPDLPNLRREGIEAATHFVESTLTAAPGGYRAPFRGRVWLLVGPRVYSASESFAVFCKATGFATLVGQPTGGDGIGALDPVMMRLPNSGLLIQYTMMFGLNPDGSSSEEAGTAPDILSPAGEPALVTALRAAGAA